jgi:hypothetical protein
MGVKNLSLTKNEIELVNWELTLTILVTVKEMRIAKKEE